MVSTRLGNGCVDCTLHLQFATSRRLIKLGCSRRDLAVDLTKLRLYVHDLQVASRVRVMWLHDLSVDRFGMLNQYVQLNTIEAAACWFPSLEKA
jgi:hypothetical protein